MTIGKVCNRHVVITGQETSILEVAQLMRKYHVGDVVVVERKGDLTLPVGIITDRDIVVELIAQEVDLHSVTTGDVMSYALVSAKENESIGDALQRMLGNGVRRIPVVNEEGGLEGILTVDDMIELLAEELNMLARVAGRSQDLEEEKRT